MMAHDAPGSLTPGDLLNRYANAAALPTATDRFAARTVVIQDEFLAEAVLAEHAGQSGAVRALGYTALADALGY